MNRTAIDRDGAEISDADLDAVAGGNIIVDIIKQVLGIPGDDGGGDCLRPHRPKGE
jgi:hypothetical protein